MRAPTDEAPEEPLCGPLPRAWVGGALGLLVVLGVWARCTRLRTVFPAPHQVELIPADSHYYVRFALLQLRSFPRFTRLDPYVNFPTGAHILWPPLHAWLVAAAVAVAGGGSAEQAAAWVGPVLSGVLLTAMAALSLRVQGALRALGVTALLAFIPAMVWSGSVGNADHHVHEPMVIAAAALTLGRALRQGKLGWAAWAGALLGLGRFLTPTAFAFVPLMAMAIFGAVLVNRSSAGRWGSVAAVCGGACALVLALGVLSWGDAGSLSYEALTWFHPLLAVACFGAVSAVAWRVSGAPHWRSAWMVVVPAALALVRPVVRAVGHLGRVDPLLAVVDESAPLWRDPQWAVKLLGVTWVLLPLAFAGALRRVLRERDVEGLPALTATACLLVATAVQARFVQALSGAAAVLIPGGLPWLVPSKLVRARRAGGVLLALASLTVVPELRLSPAEPPDPVVVGARPTLRWMREHTPAASADPFGPERPAYGVVASYLLGHFINLWAERPSVASTFSQAEAHQAANQRASAVLAAPDDPTAYAAARATGARYVLATPSVILGYPRTERARVLLGHLLDHAGMATSMLPATAHFQLVHDSREQRAVGGPYARLFQVVPGANLQGEVSPGSLVRARLELVTGNGQTLDYERTTTSDGEGRFALVVAYATDGAQEVRPVDPRAGYTVFAGARTYRVAVTEEQVEAGASVRVTAAPVAAERP